MSEDEKPNTRVRFKLPKLVLEPRKLRPKKGKYVPAQVMVEPKDLLFMQRFLRANGSSFSEWVRGQMAAFREHFREYYDGELKDVLDD